MDEVLRSAARLIKEGGVEVLEKIFPDMTVTTLERGFMVLPRPALITVGDAFASAIKARAQAEFAREQTVLKAVADRAGRRARMESWLEDQIPQTLANANTSITKAVARGEMACDIWVDDPSRALTFDYPGAGHHEDMREIHVRLRSEVTKRLQDHGFTVVYKGGGNWLNVSWA